MKNGLKGLIGIALSVGLLYVTVYYGGKAWQRSQSGEKLV